MTRAIDVVKSVNKTMIENIDTFDSFVLLNCVFNIQNTPTVFVHTL